MLQTEVESKRLGLLRDLVPTARLIAVLLNPTFADYDAQLQDIQKAASTVGQQIHVLRASTESEVGTAFASMNQLHVGALLVGADPYLNALHAQITALAARYAIPARDFTRAGGLASYGVNFAGAYHQVGIYTGRILKGEKPADLPVVQPIKFEFAINLKTAQALGLTVPLHVQQMADEVIQ